MLRAKALAEEAVRESELDTIVFAPSIVFAPEDRYMTLLARLSLLPAVMPFSGRGRAQFQPIWVADVADAVMSAIASPGSAAAPAVTSWRGPTS